MNATGFIRQKLDQRIADNSLRQLIVRKNFVDFCSNDYLGINTTNLLGGDSKDAWRHGSGGARTLSGNYDAIEEAETEIAAFHDAEAALIFNSGYTANLGLMSCLPQRSDTILYDFLSHASLRDGIRLSTATSFSFDHNDINDLEIKLKNAKGNNKYVVTESLFSMDGDFAPLEKIVPLCERYGALLIVDEAHATGVVGEKGEGLVQQLGLQKRIFARIHTFGKALGVHGAAILGSAELKNYLINFSRPFIFTTALPEYTIQCIRKSYSLFPFMTEERARLEKLIQRFRYADFRFEKLDSSSPIQGLVIPGNDHVKRIAGMLSGHELDVRPILYPTVPKGKERLRINLHSFNNEKDVIKLIGLLS
jgi:8-amino-7-oxononanoate synthase